VRAVAELASGFDEVRFVFLDGELRQVFVQAAEDLGEL
jgi:hypothetical protein